MSVPINHPLLENVSHETMNAFELYERILQKWQSHINLVANPNEFWERHLLDSLQLHAIIKDLWKSSESPLIADVGSGGGFPGLVLAMMRTGRVHLIESDRRKAIFLQEVSRETMTKVSIHNVRAENHAQHYDIVTARALAPLCDLFVYAEPLLKEDAICVFPKGRNWSIEETEARKHWDFRVECLSSKTGDSGVILIIKDLKRKN